MRQGLAARPDAAEAVRGPGRGAAPARDDHAQRRPASGDLQRSTALFLGARGARRNQVSQRRVARRPLVGRHAARRPGQLTRQVEKRSAPHAFTRVPRRAGDTSPRRRSVSRGEESGGQRPLLAVDCDRSVAKLLAMRVWSQAAILKNWPALKVFLANVQRCCGRGESQKTGYPLPSGDRGEKRELRAAGIDHPSRLRDDRTA